MNYSDFLKSKTDYGAESGFTPLWMPAFLFDFQASLTDWAIRKGRAAIFADCGMGKTPIQLVWAENIVRKTNRPVLILTPLAVTRQTLGEATKFGIEAHRAEPGHSPTAIQVTNYEQLHHLDAGQFAGVVCDESSILKSFDGTRKAQITEFMRRVSYRLLCTATAAPNDWTEIGTSSEALGHLGYMDMITRFFVADKVSYALTDRISGRDKWRLKGHAEEPFWKWIASWARAARKPSDLGFDDDGFILPPLTEERTVVKASRPRQGMLFDVAAANFHEEREVTRRTIPERCEMVAQKVAEHDVSLVWCHLNDEGDTLERIIPDSVQVAGSDPDGKKEEAADWFVNGTGRRTLITKPKIFGFGLNFQNCAHMTYFPTHSYEQFYQAERRCWRFGQTRPVMVDLIDTDGGERITENLLRKSRAADQMFINMVRHMNDALSVSAYSPNGKDVRVPQWLLSKL